MREAEKGESAVTPKKLVLSNSLSPGDVVMLTAAVRDLHQTYPGRFITDVRTPFPNLWENNPYLTTLDSDAPDVTTLECHYPLIDKANTTPHHCIHGFRHFLNQELGLAIKATAFCGDIHLSELEKSWFSQIHEIVESDVPYWIIDAGGKYDVTIKWWDIARYQAVVDALRDRILFVQVGCEGHHHPRLDGVVDLRGKTTLRQLARLIYHSEASLCSVTALMHLTAAVPLKGDDRVFRPCVVVAGAREPAHWEAYPDHQFIHNVGALPCSTQGGCWKDRVYPLGDGDERDAPERLCSEPCGVLPRCMDMITAEEVVRRIETYYVGGALTYLTRGETELARRAVEATRANHFVDGDAGKKIR